MIYKLRFHEAALTEWHKLDGSVRDSFKRKLQERLQYPEFLAPHWPACLIAIRLN
jgi:mRNA interferase RelE/StbE